MKEKEDIRRKRKRRKWLKKNKYGDLKDTRRTYSSSRRESRRRRKR